MKEDVEYLRTHRFGEVLLPLVEQIDATLLPEVFWRAIAMRPPIGDPRCVVDLSPGYLAELVSWYDREAAAAVFEPLRTMMEAADDSELAGLSRAFESWSFLDP